MRLLLALLLLVTVTALAVLSVRQYFEVEEIALPNLTGLHFEDAARMLRDRQLVPVTFPENIAGVAVNTVTSQSPEPGFSVRRGRRVAIGVNTPSDAVLTPNLVGLVIDAVLETAHDGNIEVTDVVYLFDEAPAGQVLTQNREPGTQLLDRALVLGVSRGRDRADIRLPDLTGLDVEVATGRLKALGFTRIERLASTVSFDRPGTVAGQFHIPDEVVSASTPVILFFALGTSTVVRVPNVSGLPLWRAQLALRAAGLEVGHVRYVTDTGRALGVIQVEPADLTVVGTPVAVTINGEPGGANILLGADEHDPGSAVDDPPTTLASERRAVPFTFNAANLGIPALIGQDFDLRLVVSDSRGERSVLDRRIRADEVVSTTITVYGDEPLLQTYINGDLYLAWRP